MDKTKEIKQILKDFEIQITEKDNILELYTDKIVKLFDIGCDSRSSSSKNNKLYEQGFYNRNESKDVKSFETVKEYGDRIASEKRAYKNEAKNSTDKAMCSLTYTKRGDCKSYDNLRIIKGDRNKIIESLPFVAGCYVFKGDFKIEFDNEYVISDITRI